MFITQSCPTLCDPMDCNPSGSSVHRDSPGKNTGVGCHALLSGDLPKPGTEPMPPTLQVDSLPFEPPGMPMNTGVGCYAFLQGIFPIQGFNPGLPHSRQILYQLSQMGSLSHFHGIFLTQESNWDLLHCRWILDQLRYQGSPISTL